MPMTDEQIYALAEHHLPERAWILQIALISFARAIERASQPDKSTVKRLMTQYGLDKEIERAAAEKEREQIKEIIAQHEVRYDQQRDFSNVACAQYNAVRAVGDAIRARSVSGEGES